MKTDESSIILTVPIEKYWISKYPITNSHYAKFIEAGGYMQKKWWTEAGWDAKLRGWESFKDTDGIWKLRATDKPWIKPRYWTDRKWNHREHPVVGISWYEAVAFCLWLSVATGEKIMLPTEDQWQYAAQGDDGREFPWGANWDSNCCNNNSDSKGIGRTSSVRQYDGKGDSPFGVVDMAGNVWKWCLTGYSDRRNDVNDNSVRRVLRGGAWYSSSSEEFRCDYRAANYPRYRENSWGFRISRS
jgi:formylglycine-generating enzyme required for sulfatase activity